MGDDKFGIVFVKFGDLSLHLALGGDSLKEYRRAKLMQIAICDDVKSLRKSLRKVIETTLQLEGAAYDIVEYESGEGLLTGMKQGVPDILFLDIEMEGLNGMEAARQLRKEYKDTVIIFVTAYPDFVFQGYEVQAFHYILKPYKESKIKDVLEKALEEIAAEKNQYYVVEQKGQSLKLPWKEILCFQSEGRSVHAIKERGNIKFYGKLSEIEEEMPPSFIRVHNRYLVNLKYVSRIDAGHADCGGLEIPVSRAHRQDLAVAFARMILK